MFFKIKATREKRERGEGVDYSNCKIFVITSLPNIEPYYGFTTQALSARLLDLRYSYEHGKYIDPTLAEHLATGMERIDKVEDYPCESFNEARERVAEYNQ